MTSTSPPSSFSERRGHKSVSPALRKARGGGIAFPILVFLGVGMVLALVVWQSHEHLKPDNPPAPGEVTDRAFYGGWMQFDTGWYLDIARHGYDEHQRQEFDAGRQSSVAFFPAYPLTVRQVAHLTGGDEVPALMLTTLVCGLAFTLLFWRWCRDRLSTRARKIAVVLLLVYPYSWFLFGSGYADAFFLTFVVTAFVLVDADRPVLAGLAGAVATAARPTGLAVFIGLAAVVIEQRQAVTFDWSTRRWRPEFHLDRLRPRDSGVLLSLAGLVAYCSYLAVEFGDPFAFSTVQKAPGWDQAAGPHTWFKVAFFGHVLHDAPSFSIRLVLQALLTLAFFVAIPLVARRFGWGYATYAFAVIAIPVIGTGDFQGLGRYLIAAFPVFALAADWLSRAGRERLLRATVAVSGVGMLVLASFFARGFYLT